MGETSNRKVLAMVFLNTYGNVISPAYEFIKKHSKNGCCFGFLVQSKGCRLKIKNERDLDKNAENVTQPEDVLNVRVHINLWQVNNTLDLVVHSVHWHVKK